MEEREIKSIYNYIYIRPVKGNINKTRRHNKDRFLLQRSFQFRYLEKKDSIQTRLCKRISWICCRLLFLKILFVPMMNDLWERFHLFFSIQVLALASIFWFRYVFFVSIEKGWIFRVFLYWNSVVLMILKERRLEDNAEFWWFCKEFRISVFLDFVGFCFVLLVWFVFLCGKDWIFFNAMNFFW